MITSVIINKIRYALKKEDVIGEGGEAIIFSLGKEALKLYRSPNQQRGEKLKAFFKAGFSLPKNILFPLDLARDNTGKIVGFTMMKLRSGCDPIAVLGNRKYCAQNRITTKSVVDIFCRKHKTLGDIHKEGIVVGDLNDRNEVLDPSHRKIAWIDVDSWQWGPYPCMVGTEAFLSPDLYNIDLSQRPYFSEMHDWYSFVVLLFRSLLRVHPFRAGIHSHYKSLMTRAEKGITVLDKDVIYPTIALSPDVLSDDLINTLLVHLKRKSKGPFPIKLLEQFMDILVECPSCGLWYAGIRKSCPGCQVKNMFDMRLKQILAGCECETIISTPGRIIFFQIMDKNIYCMADESGITYLYKKTKSGNVRKSKLFNTRSGARFGFFDKNLVICTDTTSENSELLVLDVSNPDSPKPVLKTITKAISGGRAVFDCSSKYLYRVIGSRIMRGQVFGSSNKLLEREVMLSLEGQTWFTVSSNPSGPEILMGFYRVFGDLKWFLVRSDDETSFQRFDVNISELNPGESIIDMSIKFSKTSALVFRKTRKRGVDYVRMDVVSGDDGSVSYSKTMKVSEVEHLENIHGRAFNKGMITHPTDKGIVHENISTDQRGALVDSDQFVSDGDALYAYGNNTIAVTDDRVLLIKSKKTR